MQGRVGSGLGKGSRPCTMAGDLVVGGAGPAHVLTHWCVMPSAGRPLCPLLPPVRRSYPLFASSSDDATVHVFHGMVYKCVGRETPLSGGLGCLAARGLCSTSSCSRMPGHGSACAGWPALASTGCNGTPPCPPSRASPRLLRAPPPGPLTALPGPPALLPARPQRPDDSHLLSRMQLTTSKILPTLPPARPPAAT